MCLLILGSSPALCALLQLASSRIPSAYRPKTLRTHQSHFTLFLQFLQFIQQDILEATHHSILAFIEFLCFNNLSHTSIQAYLSSLRSQFKLLSLPLTPFTHYSVTLALRSIALHIPVRRKVKGIFDLQSLFSIISSCTLLPSNSTYKALFLTAFFAFFRLSNLVPPSVSSFSPLIHLCRADFIPHSDFATIVIKWSKTLQKQSQFATVQIPVLSPSPLCPVTALQAMINAFPLPPNAPLFAIPQGQSFVPLTESKVRKTLSSILTSLGLDPSSHSFHCFRRSGASLAFNADVSLQSIQHQGTWTSEAVWAYIVTNPQAQGSVSLAFKKLLQP